jgi:preprotein translocase subunit SecB
MKEAAMSEQAEEPRDAQFALQRIYLKDASFESPRAPEAFMGQWKPKVNLELNSQHKPVGTDLFEVGLRVTVTVKKEDDEVVYLSEVEQAGIFMIKGLKEEALAQTLGSFCPSTVSLRARGARFSGHQRQFPSFDAGAS